uniref:Uncharacterized protein n=1 Tax=Glossina pallidipes TaxID=7398 RepID=A0A1B0A4J5_GLOPL
MELLQHNIKKRKDHLGELMSQIRLPVVSTELLTNHIVAEPLLRQDNNCCQFLIEALNSQLTRITELNDSFHVFLIGGKRDGVMGTKECKVYDVSKKKQASISSLNEDKFNNSAVCLNGVIYSVVYIFNSTAIVFNITVNYAAKPFLQLHEHLGGCNHVSPTNP